MFGGYQWANFNFSQVNFGTGETADVDYGGHEAVVSNPNPGTHDAHPAYGGNHSAGADDARDFGSGSENINDRQHFDRIIDVMADLYSFDHALESVPALKAYFGVDAVKDKITAESLDNVKNFLNPADLAADGGADAGATVLGLAELSLENPPKKVDSTNRHRIITPALLIEAFRTIDSFEPAARYHVRQNIIQCLSALAELQRHKNDLSKINPQNLIAKVQHQRLASNVHYQAGREAIHNTMSEADRAAHVQELARRTLARLQQVRNVKQAAPDFAALGLQPPGNPRTLDIVRRINAGGDRQYAGNLARLTLDNMADLVVEVDPAWRLPLKTAIADAVADYLGVTIADVTTAEINSTRDALSKWARDRRRTPPDIRSVLACIPSLCRETMLEMDPATKRVVEVQLSHADDPLLPAAVAKAIKMNMSSLESRVTGLIRDPRFYNDIYEDGQWLQTALNLHGMYLQCSNPANRNMAFQTPAQFNHPDYATRRSSGLYVNVNRPYRPSLECRESAEARLVYIDKLWSLFRVIVLDKLNDNLVRELARHRPFQEETDPARRRQMAGEILDRCIPYTFGGAAGAVTGITRDLLVNAAIEVAAEDPVPR